MSGGEEPPTPWRDKDDAALMPRQDRVDAVTLRMWRRSRGWDIPKLASRLIAAARDAGVSVATHGGLVKMVAAWERGDHDVSERYELLYRAAVFTAPDPAPPARDGVPYRDLGQVTVLAASALDRVRELPGPAEIDAITSLRRARGGMTEAEIRARRAQALNQLKQITAAAEELTRLLADDDEPGGG